MQLGRLRTGEAVIDLRKLETSYDDDYVHLHDQHVPSAAPAYFFAISKPYRSGCIV